MKHYYIFRNDNIPGEVPYLSEAESLAKAARASGKFGGVAGVLAGVHNWNRQKEKELSKLELCAKCFNTPQRIGKKIRYGNHARLQRERILDFPNKFFCCCWKTTTTNGSRARDSFGYTGNGQAKRISFVVFLNAPRTHQEQQQQQQNNVPDCNGGDGHGRLLRSWPHWLLGRKYLRPSVDPFVERTWKMYRKKEAKQKSS